jgi:hypothetical protein
MRQRLGNSDQGGFAYFNVYKIHHSIRVKFSLMFAIMATSLIVMAITDAMQSRATVKQMQEFS